MNDKIEAKGKTVKEAVAEALLRLGARREEVIVKVMEEPKSGFLGLLGGRQAKVLVEKKRGGGRSRRGGNRRNGGKAHSLSDNGGRSRGQGRDRDSSGRRDGEGGRRSAARNEAPDQETRNSRPEEAGGGSAENRSSGQDGGRSGNRRRRRGSRGRGRGRRPAARTETAAAGEPNGNVAPRDEAQAQPARNDRDDRRDSRPDENRRQKRNRRSQRGRNRGAREEEVVEKTVARTVENTPEPPREPAPEAKPETRENTGMNRDKPAPDKAAHAAQTDAVIREGLRGTSYAKPLRDVSEADRPAALEELASGMLVRAGFPTRCQVIDGEYLQVRVVTDDSSAGMLIGRHGATVDSVEHIVERMISTASGDRVKMNLDINNYRRRRQDTLADRVYDAIAKVQETGQEFHMEPMDARDRRLVHLQVAESEGLTTETVIVDGAKHVVISRVDGETPGSVEEAEQEPAVPAEEAQPET